MRWDSYRVLIICMGGVDTKMPHLGPTVTESLATPLKCGISEVVHVEVLE